MTNIQRLTKELNLSRTDWTQYGLIVAWFLAMVCVPILKWIYGVEVIPTAITAALIVQFLAVTFAVVNAWGMTRTLIVFGVVAVLTWGVEFIGSSTGLPFGEYHYTDALQPQIGHVPLLIPVAWFMMFAPAWAVAQIVVGRNNRLAYIAVSAAALTAWDLFLDPQMVAWEFWIWAEPGAYFGIPLLNYFGWLLTGVVVTAVIRPYRYRMPLTPLLTVYGVVWFLQSVGQALFWGQPGPALVGGVVMGGFLLFAIRNYRNALSDAA